MAASPETGLRPTRQMVGGEEGEGRRKQQVADVAREELGGGENNVVDSWEKLADAASAPVDQKGEKEELVLVT